MGPVRELGPRIASVALSAIRPMGLRDCEAALTAVRPSASQAGLAEFEAFAKEFGTV